MVVQVDLDSLLKRVGALLEDGPYVLGSGRVSPYYFDSKELTLDPDGQFVVANYFLEKLKLSTAQAVGGMADSAIPIVSAIVAESRIQGHPLPGFFVRKEAKAHGTEKLIEGKVPLDRSCPVAIIDDVVTGGRSILKAIDAIEDLGNPISDVMCILDRREGGGDELKARGYDLRSMFTVELTAKGVVELEFNP